LFQNQPKTGNNKAEKIVPAISLNPNRNGQLNHKDLGSAIKRVYKFG
jgi:hypothetical protein